MRLSPSGSDALFGILNIVEEGITQFLSKKEKSYFLSHLWYVLRNLCDLAFTVVASGIQRT